jgi:hypothetical protein
MHCSKEGWKYTGGAFPGRGKITLRPASFASSFGKQTRSGAVVALRQKRSSRVLERRHFTGLRERLSQACNISGGQRARRSVRSVLSQPLWPIRGRAADRILSTLFRRARSAFGKYRDSPQSAAFCHQTVITLRIWYAYHVNDIIRYLKIRVQHWKRKKPFLFILRYLFKFLQFLKVNKWKDCNI